MKRDYAITAKHTAYQAELVRLLQLSTLTPGLYNPSDQVKTNTHTAVFVNDLPVILCGPSDNHDSITIAETLAVCPALQAACRAVSKDGQIRSGTVAGSDVPWRTEESAVVTKPSGHSEPGGDNGPLHVIVLDDPHQALTVLLCVNTGMARILDSTAPELDNGYLLAALGRQKKDSHDDHRFS